MFFSIYQIILTLIYKKKESLHMLHSNKLHYDWTFLAIILLKDSYGMKKYDNCSDNQIFPKSDIFQIQAIDSSQSGASVSLASK